MWCSVSKPDLQEAEFFSPLSELFSQREGEAEGERQRWRENMKLEEVCDPRVQKDLLKRKRWREKHDQHILLVCVRADMQRVLKDEKTKGACLGIVHSSL